MAKTPEGAVKAKVRAVLGRYAGDGGYAYWPVPGGYGQTTLDVIGAFRGHAFAIETKAPGKKPTLRQTGVIREMEGAAIKVFVIDSDAGVNDLEIWLEAIRAVTVHDPHFTPDTVDRRPV